MVRCRLGEMRCGTTSPSASCMFGRSDVWTLASSCRDAPEALPPCRRMTSPTTAPTATVGPDRACACLFLISPCVYLNAWQARTMAHTRSSSSQSATSGTEPVRDDASPPLVRVHAETLQLRVGSEPAARYDPMASLMSSSQAPAGW